MAIETTEVSQHKALELQAFLNEAERNGERRYAGYNAVKSKPGVLLVDALNADPFVFVTPNTVHLFRSEPGSGTDHLRQRTLADQFFESVEIKLEGPAIYVAEPDQGTNEDRSAKWVLGREAKNLEEARELVEVAFERAGMSAPQMWRVSEGSLTPWEYADVELGGRKLTVGISAGGVVSFDGDPFTPGDRQLNVTLSRVERSRHAWYVEPNLAPPSSKPAPTPENDRITFNVWHDGDGSVGIPGDQATVEMYVGGFDPEDRKDYIEQVREMLREGFGQLWDTRPKVMTDEEVRGPEVEQPGRWKMHETDYARVYEFRDGDARVLVNKDFSDRGSMRIEVHGYRAWSGYEGETAGYVSVVEAQKRAEEMLADPSSHLSPYGVEQLELAKAARQKAQADAGGPVGRDLERELHDLRASTSKLLNAALTYIESPEKVDVDWLAAAIKRYGSGEALPEQAIALTNANDPVSGYVLAFPGASDAEASELIDSLRKGGTTVYRVEGAPEQTALRDVLDAAGLEPDDLRP